MYLDTSVFGGCLDTEFQTDSRRVVQAVSTGELIGLVSEVTLRELADAPQAVRAVLTGLPPERFERWPTSDEALTLRDAYLAAGIVGPRWADDALHVAMATIARADAVISWNFRHIVRLDRIKLYNAINLVEGYGIMTIVSPREVAGDEPDED